MHWKLKCTPQGHFRCVMVCYHTHMPQKTRPGISFKWIGSWVNLIEICGQRWLSNWILSETQGRNYHLKKLRWFIQKQDLSMKWHTIFAAVWLHLPQMVWVSVNHHSHFRIHGAYWLRPFGTFHSTGVYEQENKRLFWGEGGGDKVTQVWFWQGYASGNLKVIHTSFPRERDPLVRPVTNHSNFGPNFDQT